MTAAADTVELQARETLLSGDHDAAVLLYEDALQLSPENAKRIQAVLRALKTEETEFGGLHLYLPRDVVKPGILLALADGSFELGEREAAVWDIRPGDIVLELGAGLGSVTLAIGMLHPNTPIIALEANPRLEEILKRNITKNNGNVEVIGALAALEDGEADFHIAPSFVSSSMLRVAKNAKTVSRPTVDVNRLLREKQPTVLVMDIEGSEIDLLQGLDLGPVRRIVVEFHPTISANAAITDTIAHLIAQGFDLNLPHCRGQVVSFDRRVTAT